jgi:hypothetical protein
LYMILVLDDPSRAASKTRQITSSVVLICAVMMFPLYLDKLT